MHVCSHIQWNLSNPDTLRSPDLQAVWDINVFIEVSLFQGVLNKEVHCSR